MTPIAAASPIVNRAAMAGGSHPEPVQALRRSMLADDRGREPTGLRGVAEAEGMTFRASIKLGQALGLVLRDRAGAKAFQTALANSASRRPWRRHDGPPAFFRKHLSCPCWGRFGRKRSRLGKPQFSD